ncbi:hypothetical protein METBISCDRAFT_25746 [Metschnikowia bicuspidata]|uniref:Uncharacterized protein n=1 Tax=Metschnikowia bicuspidata TaxID=27322 RepID=A0A4P9ZHM7_9ASCO|nr:hypothetical protein METBISCDRAFT_25746 [Metschnikowia bicuspidata]
MLKRLDHPAHLLRGTHLRWNIIKIVLAHTGKIIGIKFRPQRCEGASTPLKQIADYSQFMTVDDLQR